MPDIILVNVPFSQLQQPALALSLLKAIVMEKGMDCRVLYGNMRFAEKIGIKEYMRIFTYTAMYTMGEMIFAESAGFGPSGEEKYVGQMVYYKFNAGMGMKDEEDFRQFLARMKAAACRFVDELTDEILAGNPKIVGSSNVFQQNNACFAIFRALKAKSPDVVTIMGGGNCCRGAGVAISETIPWIDYVFSGEVDEVFPEICVKLLEEGNKAMVEDLPYGVIRKGRYASEEVPYRVTKDVGALPVPDYADYFEELERSPLAEEISPAVMVEGSRGCWWGEKKPCSFCGLTQRAHTYRAKDTQRFLNEINELNRRYGITNFTLSDCILSRGHLAELIPVLNDQPKKYTFFSEVKSNMTKRELHDLRRAGFTFLQPGIESLQDDYLRLMNKGNTAINHVALLKHAKSYGICFTWSVLVGFPGERDEWLYEMSEVIPLLSHLQPPSGVIHIIYQRYNAYVQDQERYGLDLRVPEFYGFVFNDDYAFAERVAMNFEPRDPELKLQTYDLTKKGDAHRSLLRAYCQWVARRIEGDNLRMYAYPPDSAHPEGRLDILDLRTVAARSTYTLTGARKRAYELCDSPADVERVKAGLVDAGYSPGEAEDAVDFLVRSKLALSIKGKVLALAAEKTGYSYDFDMKRFPFGTAMLSARPRNVFTV